MKKLNTISKLIGASILAVSSMASASIVTSATVLGASDFALTTDANVENSDIWVHNTQSATGSNAIDWYSFTLSEQSNVIFDTDTIYNFFFQLDTTLALYSGEPNSTAEAISAGAFADDDTRENAPAFTPDAGSRQNVFAPGTVDSYIAIDLAPATYFLSVSNAFDAGGLISPTYNYDLHISIENSSALNAGATPVSEPSMIALMGLGVFGLGLARRKMKK